MNNPNPNHNKYTTNKTRLLKDLKKRWVKWTAEYERANQSKEALNHYIVFLHESERYSKNEIAALIGLTRERVGQIIQYTKSRKVVKS